MTWNRSMRVCSSTSATACCSPSATARDGRRFPERYSAAYAETAQALGAEGLLRMLALATEEEQAFRRSSQQDLVLEVLLVRLALLDRTVDLDRALRALGAGGGGGRPAPETGGKGLGPGGSKRRRSRRVRKRRRRRAVRSPRVPARRVGRGRGGDPRSAPDGGRVAQGRSDLRLPGRRGHADAAPHAEFKLEQLSTRGMLDPLASVLARRWGFSGRIRVEPAGDQPPDAMPASPVGPGNRQRPTGREIEAGAIDARLEGDPLLRQVVDLFDASVVKVRPSS